jgi:hypothetical protein
MDIKGERGRLGETGAEIDTCKLLEVISIVEPDDWLYILLLLFAMQFY